MFKKQLRANTVVILLLVMGLAVALALYVLVILPAAQRRTEARYFRQLGRLERNANDKAYAYQMLARTMRYQLEDVALDVLVHEVYPGNNGSLPLSSPDCHPNKLTDAHVTQAYASLLKKTDFFPLVYAEQLESAGRRPWPPLMFDSLRQNLELRNETHVLPKKTYCVVGKVPIKQFVSDLWRGDFHHLLLLQGEQIVFSTFSTPNQLTLTLRVGKDGRSPSSSILLADSTGLGIAHATTVVLNGESYRLFLRTIRVQDLTLTLGGAIPLSQFQNEVQALSPSLVSWLLMALLLIVLGGPLLKICMLGPDERLRRRDVAFCGGSLVVTMAMLVLIGTDTYTARLVGKPALQNQLRTLVTNTRGRFTQELLAMRAQLSEADLKMRKDAQFENYTAIATRDTVAGRAQSTDQIKPGLPSVYQANALRFQGVEQQPAPQISKDYIVIDTRDSTADWARSAYRLTPNLLPERLRTYPFAGRIHWADTAGYTRVRWESARYWPYLDAISKRAYFQEAITPRLQWSIGDLTAGLTDAERQSANQQIDSSKRFTFQSVVSWGSGRKNFVVACSVDAFPVHPPNGLGLKCDPKRQKDWVLRMALLTTDSLRSFTQALVAPGFEVCLVTEAGEVWAHSDNRRTLNENLVEEADSGAALNALLRSHRVGQLEVDYHGQPHLAYVQPLGRLPYSIVALADLSYPQTQQAQTLTLAALLQTGLLSVGLLGLIILLLAKRPSKLLAGHRRLTWLWPHPSAAKAYLFVAVGAAWIAFVTVGWFCFFPLPLVLLGSQVMALAWLAIYTWQVLSTDWTHRRKRQLPPWKHRPRLLVLIGMMVVSNVFLIGLTSDWAWLYLLFEQALVAVPLIALLKKFTRGKSAKPFIPQLHLSGWWAEVLTGVRQYRNAYGTMVLGWLVVVAILPAYGCYKVAHAVEQHVAARYSQWSLARDCAALDGFISHDAQLLKTSPDYLLSKSRKNQIGSLFTITYGQKAALASGRTAEGDFFTELLNRLRMPYHPAAIQGQALVGAFSPNAQLYWPPLCLKAEQDILRVYQPGNGGKVITVRAQVGPAHLATQILFGFSSHFLNHLLVWGEMLALAVSLWFLIRFLVRRIFHVRQFDHFRNPVPAPFAPASPAGLATLPAHTLIWVVSPSGARLTDVPELKKTLDAMPSKVVRVRIGDVNPILLKQQLLQEPAPLCVVEDADTGLGKPELLEKVLGILLATQRVGIMLSIQPLQLKNLAAAPPWLITALGTCQTVYWPLHEGKLSNLPAPLPAGITLRDNIKERVWLECRISAVMKGLQPTVAAWAHGKLNAHDTELEPEDVILYVQGLAEAHYQALWQRLSDHERFLLYDMAQDGLVNTRDPQPIEMLLRKGLLLYEREENRLQLINESFRNFVLTTVLPAESLKWEKAVTRVGTWERIRMPLILLLTAAGLFLFSTQQSAFKALGAYLAGITAFIPMIFRFIELFAAKQAKDGA